MKTRTDFVSNSSSCSFIVKLHSEKDVELINKCIKCYTVGLFKLCDKNYFTEKIDSITNSDINDYINIDIGDDNLETINEFENLTCDIKDIMKNNSDNTIEIYKDPYAHYTFGDKQFQRGHPW